MSVVSGDNGRCHFFPFVFFGGVDCRLSGDIGRCAGSKSLGAVLAVNTQCIVSSVLFVCVSGVLFVCALSVNAPQLTYPVALAASSAAKWIKSLSSKGIFARDRYALRERERERARERERERECVFMCACVSMCERERMREREGQ